MLVCLYSPKGGSGTTVSCVLAAKVLMDFGQVTLIDACNGDLDVVLGLDEQSQYCFEDWVSSPEPSVDSLEQIAVHVNSGLSCITSNNNGLIYKVCEFNQDAISVLETLPGNCVIDLGKCDQDYQQEILKRSDIAVIVMRSCYMALHKASNEKEYKKYDACVVVKEPGRSISSSQIAQTLDVDALIEIEARRDFAKVIDAGVLLYRTPQTMIKPFSDYLYDVAQTTTETPIDHDVFSGLINRNNTDFWRDDNDIANEKHSMSVISNKYSQHVLSRLAGKL